MHNISKFFSDQLSVWPLAAGNFRSLKTASVKDLNVGGLSVKVQYNPCRIASSTAETDEKAIAARPCFLCVKTRPQEQFHLKFEGRKGRGYNIQVNPFPIFPGHLVIARDCHTPQTIWHHFPDALSFVKEYPDHLLFYNGPCSGASAPDHLHFQAIPCGMLPLENAADSFLNAPGEPLAELKDAKIFKLPVFCRGVFVLKAATAKSMSKLFYRLLECAPVEDGEDEPRFNFFAYVKGGEYRTIVVFRSLFRSHHYFTDGPEHLTMSLGAADLGGYFVTPKGEDFEKLTDAMLSDMVEEVTFSAEQEAAVLWRLTRKQRTIDVGIMSAREIEFEIISDGAGPQKVSWYDGRINYNGLLYDELVFDAITRSTLFAEPTFILNGVTIGVDFHWQRKRTFKYAGSLRFIVDGDNIVAINRIGVEDYLLSVISSEMKSTAPLESLKSHAIISRSWLMRNLATHKHFDVCADDHCQRYQGLTMAVGKSVREAIDSTWGKVLRYDGEICDARYSKCCGGRTELFSTCWEDEDKPYLQSVEDPYCDCDDIAVLSTVLNDYDLETKDFRRWTVRYSEPALSELVKRRTGLDFGTITALEPLQRGPSGRIMRLRIVGSLRSEVIGKELAIRRALSDSHLKSSAFDVIREGSDFILKGYGWGHGVGLCQIGAAVMASKGWKAEDILEYYYPGAQIC